MSWVGDIPVVGKPLDAAGGAVGDAFRDFSRVGRNNFQPTPYNWQQQDWGGDPNAAQNYYNTGARGLAGSNSDAAYASGMARDNSPQAYENQDLSDREATTAGYYQGGALNLALKGAMGNQPSEAAYQLQSGLDKALANQSATAGAARGAGGIALASANAGANSAALQNQAFNDAGRLRAQEVANYTGMLGGMSGQAREQDQNRLGQANQMAQFNAQNNTQRQLGFLGAASGARNTGLGYYTQMPHGYDQAYQGGIQQQEAQQQGYNTSLGLGGSIAQANADQAAGMRDKFTGAGVQGAQTAGSLLMSQKGHPS